MTTSEALRRSLGKELLLIGLLLAPFAGACPGPARAPPTPANEVVTGTIAGAPFKTVSVSAEVSGQGFLVLTAADYAIECGAFAPPDGTIAQRIVVGIDEAHQRSGTLRLELPDVADAQASAIVYDGSGDAPRTLVIRRGEIVIDTLTESRIAGSLQLDDPSADIALSGRFEIDICGPTP